MADALSGFGADMSYDVLADTLGVSLEALLVVLAIIFVFIVLICRSVCFGFANWTNGD